MVQMKNLSFFFEQALFRELCFDSVVIEKDASCQKKAKNKSLQENAKSSVISRKVWQARKPVKKIECQIILFQLKKLWGAKVLYNAKLKNNTKLRSNTKLRNCT